MLTIVMQHGVVESIDALEILCVENMLGADSMRGLGTKIGMQELKHRSKNGKTRHAKATAMLLQRLHQLIVEQRVKNNSRRLLDLRQHPIELLPCPHEWIDMLDRQHFRVLGGCRPGDRG